MLHRTLFASFLAAGLACPVFAQTGAPLSAPAAADALGLERVDLVEVGLAGVPGAPAIVRFEHDGVSQRIDLLPVSVRAEGFRLVEHREGDVYVDVAADQPVTYRGDSVTLAGAEVAASWLDDGLHARILLPDGESLWLEPLAGRVAGASYFDYGLYRDSDRRDLGFTCGVGDDDPHHTPHVDGAQVSGGDQPLFIGGGFKVAELGIDTDFEYFQDYGSSTAVTNQIESVINSMNLQYQNDVGITHTISTIIVRTTSNDPYTTTSPSSFLNQFQNHWNSQQQGIQRDVAHLFTGKNLSSSVIGIAYLSAICTNFGYGLVESDCCGSFASKTDLSAHELGHNWSAGHCNCSGFTMNSFLTAANKFNPSATIPGIINYSNNLGCIETGGGGGFQCSNEAYGVGAGAANIGTLSSTADATLGSTWPALFSGFNGSSSGLFIASGSQASIPFGAGTILVDYQNPTASVPVTTLFGAGGVPVPVPSTPTLAGLTAYTQVGILDGSFAGGYAFSNGLAVTFCN